MGKNILIADDNVKFCNSAEMILKKEGYEVDTAHNGEEALKKMKDKKYDAVLLDIIMPVLTGLDTCQKIKKDRKLRDTIVIMLSGNVTEIEISFDYGADDCFLKPVDWQKVLERMSSLIN